MLVVLCTVYDSNSRLKKLKDTYSLGGKKENTSALRLERPAHLVAPVAPLAIFLAFFCESSFKLY